MARGILILAALAVLAVGAASPSPAGQCELCGFGTSGVCKALSGVCYSYFAGTTICPPGSFECEGPPGGEPQPVDCDVSSWSFWTPLQCPTECGVEATQTRYRTIETFPEHGGRACPSPEELEETRDCPVIDCPAESSDGGFESSDGGFESSDGGFEASEGGSEGSDGGSEASEGSDDTVDCGNDVDTDGDGICDGQDNCPHIPNADQADDDGDQSGNVCDECPTDPGMFVEGPCGCFTCARGTAGPCVHTNLGDYTCTPYHFGTTCPPGTIACVDPCPNDPDNDIDQDGLCGDVDNCPSIANENQADADGDGIGDVCDACPLDADNDADGDGVCGDVDNCPAVANADQTDSDSDGAGDVCDVCPFDPTDDGSDSDGVCDDVDNCVGVANAGQEDHDFDGIGSACDICPFDPDNDADSDGVCGDVDNCPTDTNAGQEDSDGDGPGDACDVCPFDYFDDGDEDGVCGDVDNCEFVPNAGQADRDGDGVGDVCDECPDNADHFIETPCGCGTCNFFTEGPCRHDNDGHCFAYVPGTTSCVPGSTPCETAERRMHEERVAAERALLQESLDGGCPDSDSDGVCDVDDNCKLASNPGQEDTDGDGVGDACDDCPTDPQMHATYGSCGCFTCAHRTNGPCIHQNDASCTPYFPGTTTCPPGTVRCTDPCPLDPDNDIDQDEVCGNEDNCPSLANPDQADSDGDGIGDACDACPLDADNDVDGDGVCGDVDNCPATANGSQTDSDSDGAGDACDVCPFDPLDDADSDGVCGDVDNCPSDANPSQLDSDSDGEGNACDICPFDADNDIDGDGVCGDVDNCVDTANSDQLDSDGDGAGDACDPCPLDEFDDSDGDGVCGDVDNCEFTPNSDQADRDQDGVGDACDECPDNPDHFIETPCGCGTCSHFTSGPCRHNNDGHCMGYFPGTTTCVPGTTPCNELERRLHEERVAAHRLLLESGSSEGCPDADGDSVCNVDDNCPNAPNADQIDGDGDGVGDACDECPTDPDMHATYGSCGCFTCAHHTNGPCIHQNFGDASCVPYFPGTTICPPGTLTCTDPCPLDPDNDIDQDDVCGNEDNCPSLANPDQADSDGDGIGDACDACPLDADNDVDGDGVCGDVDNCPATANGSQTDSDSDGAGNACDVCPFDPLDDADSDGVCGDVDNCPSDANPSQLDSDSDGEGNACDICPFDADNDIDGDGVCGDVDNCVDTANSDQLDSDGDGPGDACDVCPFDDLNDADGDSVCGDVDNCPFEHNSDQADRDEDGVGDACDECPDNPDHFIETPCGCGTCNYFTSGPCRHNNDGHCMGYFPGTTMCVPGTTPCNELERRLHEERVQRLRGQALEREAEECDDTDADGVCDYADNCPLTRNANQADDDSDGIGDVCDECPTDAGAFLSSHCGCFTCDHKTSGPCVHNNDGSCVPYFAGTTTCPPGTTACVDPCPNDPDNDIDQDGHCGDVDNCPDAANADQADADGDGIGDACDECPLDADNDIDGDGVCGNYDNCPSHSNSDQLDTDLDNIGDVCDSCPFDPTNDASDNDGICDDVDNCVALANPGQEDHDSDGIGSACDACPFDADNDIDDDTVCGDVDNCVDVANFDQRDSDSDGAGDMCDPCPYDATDDASDQDGVCDDVDTCIGVFDPTNSDRDGDGVGDACDACPDNSQQWTATFCGCGTCDGGTDGPCTHLNDRTCVPYYVGTQICPSGSIRCPVDQTPADDPPVNDPPVNDPPVNDPPANDPPIDDDDDDEAVDDFLINDPGIDDGMFPADDDDDDDDDDAPACVDVDFGAWSGCSETCGGGIETRSKSPPLGGVACPPLQESRTCNTHDCPVDPEPTECTGCWPGTSGACKSTASNVCYQEWGGSCPAGTSRCAAGASTAVDPVVVASVSIAGKSLSASEEQRLREAIAGEMNVPVTHVVLTDTVEASDGSLTVGYVIVAPSNSNPMTVGRSADELAQQLNAAADSGSLARALAAAGVADAGAVRSGDVYVDERADETNVSGQEATNVSTASPQGDNSDSVTLPLYAVIGAGAIVALVVVGGSASAFVMVRRARRSTRKVGSFKEVNMIRVASNASQNELRTAARASRADVF